MTSSAPANEAAEGRPSASFKWKKVVFFWEEALGQRSSFWQSQEGRDWMESSYEAPGSKPCEWLKHNSCTRIMRLHHISPGNLQWGNEVNEWIWCKTPTESQSVHVQLSSCTILPAVCDLCIFYCYKTLFLVSEKQGIWELDLKGDSTNCAH